MVIGACNDQVNKKETSKIESGSDTTGRHSTVNAGDDGAHYGEIYAQLNTKN